MAEAQELNFSLVLKEIPVTLAEEDGTVIYAILKEITGMERDTYLNGVTKRMKFGADGKPTGVSSFNGLNSSLLAICLFDKATDKPIPLPKINGFPAKVQESLHQAAEKLSGLEMGAKEEAKNE